MIALDLPIPPSVNRLRKLNTAEIWRHDKWKDQADKLVTKQWAEAKLKGEPSRPHLREQPFGLTIYVNEEAYRGDLDNILKAVPDYLRRIEVISGDAKKYLRHVVLSWATPAVAPEGIRVEVWPVAAKIIGPRWHK